MSNQKRKLCRGTRLAVGLLILALCAQIHAQPRNQSAPAEPVIQTAHADRFCPVYLITVEVKVIDPRGEEASSLGKDGFTVYDNGVEQQISMWVKLGGSSKAGGEAVYALGYSPTHLYEGKPHRIRVVARGKNRRKLKAKVLSPASYDGKGYFRSPEPTPPNNGLHPTPNYVRYHR